MYRFITLTLHLPFSENIGLKYILFAETKSVLLNIIDHETNESAWINVLNSWLVIRPLWEAYMIQKESCILNSKVNWQKFMVKHGKNLPHND